MSSRMLYNRPLPVNRIVNAIADSACSRAMDQMRGADAFNFDRGTNQHAALRTAAIRSRIPRCRTRCAPRRVRSSRTAADPRLADPQERGPHLYEFSPTGNCFEYYAMSIGARSQSAKTYLETHFAEFEDCAPRLRTPPFSC